jgi:hypothetical protein
MDLVCGLEHMDRAYVSHRRLEHGCWQMDLRLERMGQVNGRCVRMGLACGSEEGTDVVDSGMGRCSHSGRMIRRILLGCCLHVSAMFSKARDQHTRVMRISSLYTSTSCS